MHYKGFLKYATTYFEEGVIILIMAKQKVIP